MSQYADWLARAMSPVAMLEFISAPAIFLNKVTARLTGEKWFFYVDQYLILPLILLCIHRRFDTVLFADHSNIVSSIFVPRAKVAVMVHDTIAIRQAAGLITGAPPVGRPGRLLQRLTLSRLKKVGRLAVNSAKVRRELAEFGLIGEMPILGCPLEPSRFESARQPAVEISRPFVLNVASDSWRKRKADLVRLWADLRNTSVRNVTLVMAGKSGTQAKSAAESLGGRVVFLDKVSDAELTWLYRNSSATVAPSIHEGFCLPVLESLYFGKWVLCAAGADYNEIFGGGMRELPFDAEGARAIIAEVIGGGELPELRRLSEPYLFEHFRARAVAAFAPITTPGGN